jgi:hypothetical protein
MPSFGFFYSYAHASEDARCVSTYLSSNTIQYINLNLISIFFLRYCLFEIHRGDKKKGGLNTKCHILDDLWKKPKLYITSKIIQLSLADFRVLITRKMLTRTSVAFPHSAKPCSCLFRKPSTNSSGRHVVCNKAKVRSGYIKPFSEYLSLSWRTGHC